MTQDPEYWSRPENDRRKPFNGPDRREQRELYMGPPVWYPVIRMDATLNASDVGHPQHHEWLLWQEDLAKDSPEDSFRRDQLHKLRISRNEDLNFILEMASRPPRFTIPTPPRRFSVSRLFKGIAKWWQSS